MKRGLAPMALVLVANALALLSAAWNRTSVTAEVEFTERQVHLQSASRDRSAMFLRIDAEFGRRPWRPQRLEKRLFVAWRITEDRLMRMDEATDARQLRQQYPRALITRDPIPAIRVPLNWRHIFDSAERADYRDRLLSPVRVRVRFGANYEPWIVAARRIE